MSIEFQIEERIEAPPERVWAALVDVDTWPAWMPKLVRIDRLEGDGPLEEGSRWREVRKMFGKEAEEVFEVVAVEPGRRLELYVDGSLGTSKRGEYRFVHRIEADEASGSRVTLEGEIGGLGKVTGLMGRVFAGPMKKSIARDLEALREHLERGRGGTQG